MKCLRSQWTCQAICILELQIHFDFLLSGRNVAPLVCSQATSQTDLENWVTAIHSACASLFAKKLGKEDTIRLLKNQTKSLFQKIDMDSKMKKMAELQLSIVSDPKNRKAIENQVLETAWFVSATDYYCSSIFIAISCFGPLLLMLSRPESNCLGHSWHGMVFITIARFLQQSRAAHGVGQHSKLRIRPVCFMSTKLFLFTSGKNVFNFHLSVLWYA